MLTTTDYYATLAIFAGLIVLDSSARRHLCDDHLAGNPCGRPAVAVDEQLGEFMCAGHLKLAAADAIQIDAWDNDGVRR